ncbi:MAG: protein rep, partial [Acidimicrobiales bacterium]
MQWSPRRLDTEDTEDDADAENDADGEHSEDAADTEPLIGRVARCGRFPRSGAMVSVRSGPFGHYLVSVMRCGSVWSCPTCSGTIRRRWERKLRRALEELAERRPDLVVRMATLTIPHRQGEALSGLLVGLNRAWGYLVAGKSWTKHERAFGIVGWLRSVEVTVGPSGWHPHLHVLLVLDGATDEEALVAWLSQRWRASCVKAGLRVPSRAHGVDFKDVGDSAAGYLTRIATEVVRADFKEAREGGLGPFQLLDLAG